jgi:fluoroquinolone transport system permease protein
MFSRQTFRALGAIDAGSISGDPLLRWMIAIPLVVAFAMRLLLPSVLVRLGDLTRVELGWMLAPFSGYVVVAFGPLIVGTVVGFLLLDQRDDRTLLAMRVTPLPLAAYLAYQLALPTLVSIPVTLAAVLVAGGLGLGPGGALLAALSGAPLAPLTAIALVALARNKLEGMALMKMASLVLGAPLASLFVPPVWDLALGVIPPFWVAHAVWALQQGENPIGFVLGAWALPAALIVLLLWRLRRVLEGE